MDTVETAHSLKHSLWDFSMERLSSFLEERGRRKFLARQIYDWLYRKLVWDPDEWSNVSSTNREWVKETFLLDLPKILFQSESLDGTRKFVVGFSDGDSVETIVIPSELRRTLCLSTQVGCAIGCLFCHTQTAGLKRNLTTGEIVGQYMVVDDWLRKNEIDFQPISNLVYMGQGEPLHNFDNVKEATLIFMKDTGLFFGQRRITLSTSGLVPQIEKLGEFPPINIAISLHAVTDEVRDQLMPINKVYDLKRLFKAIKTIPLKPSRGVTYEYLLMDGLNNRLEDIEGLCKLIPNKADKVNLILFNEYPGSKFKRPPMENAEWFQSELIRRGRMCTIRSSKGQDILAACGQLKTQFEKKSKKQF
jgi:23S rRNA (adenine2503-C2)-methyltransferase